MVSTPPPQKYCRSEIDTKGEFGIDKLARDKIVGSTHQYFSF